MAFASQQAYAQSADPWRQVAFDNKNVTMVEANPFRPQEIAVVADNKLNLTRTRGLIWEQSPVPVNVRSIAYDQVDIDTLYAGTDRGLYVSRDFGRTWQLLEGVIARNKFVVKVIATPQYIYAVTGDTGGIQNKIHRFTRTGAVQDMLYPDKNVATLEYDLSSNRLFAGSAAGVFLSNDLGQTWRLLGSGSGNFTYRIIVKDTTIWQSSGSGLFRSRDGGSSWQRLARIGEINNTEYGSSMNMRGLVVNNDHAYYGSYSNFYPFKFLVKYDGGAGYGAGLDQKVEDVSGSDNTLWVATHDGLWLNDDLISSEAKILRPVIIIPGILGSWPIPLGHAAKYKDWLAPYKGQKYVTNLVPDPIQHTYDPLLQNLEAKGYEINKTLFTFPYQWRQDNNVSAKQLSDKIDDVQKICGCPKVDLVGHSMGGLVARAYVQSDYYGDDVRNLIQIATPNAGSVNAYRQWESGEIEVNSIVDMAKKTAFQTEALHAGHLTLVQYIRQKVLSVGQLLPTFSYIEGRSYPNGYPRNEFLENLNKADKIQLLNQRISYYVIGSQKHQTLRLLQTEPSDENREYWPHGKVLKEFHGDGDGTVLIPSLAVIASASKYLDGDHGGIVAQADNFVAQALMAGYTPPSSSQVQVFEKYLIVYVKSPVAITITDEQGKVINDTESTIPHAYYTGSGEDAQMAIIPFGQEGRYSISLKGTGDGEYGVGVVEFNDATGEIFETEKTSTISTGETANYSYDTYTDGFEMQSDSEGQDSDNTNTPEGGEMESEILEQAHSSDGQNTSLDQTSGGQESGGGLLPRTGATSLIIIIAILAAIILMLCRKKLK